MKKIIDLLRKIFKPFIKKFIKPFIRTIGLRNFARNFLKPIIIISQGNRRILENKFSSFSINELNLYGITLKRKAINTSFFPNNIEEEINHLTKLYKPHDQILNYKNGDPFKSGEACKKSFYFLRGELGEHFKDHYIENNFKKKYDGKDIGLIDIYNPQLIFSSNHWINKILNESKKIIKDKIDFESKNIFYTHSNLYIYKNVSKPRCLHIDSYKKQFKCFIPLTPSIDKEKGCYAFVPSSHKFPLISLQLMGRLFNFIISNSDLGYQPGGDASLFHIDAALPILAKPRDIIITCQKGVHGDIPSNNPIDRYLLVLNYLAGEWNF